MALRALQYNHEPITKEPIVYSTLVDIWPRLATDNDSLLYKAAFTLAFFGGLHSSEYCSTSDSDIGYPRIKQIQYHTIEKVMYYKVYRSKTTTTGFTVTLACTGSEVCAHCSMTLYMKYLKALGSASRHNALFLLKGRPLSAHSMNVKIK